jgi:hypothetical protein
METDFERGVLRSGNVINQPNPLVAAAVVIFQVSNFAQQIGTKSYIPKKLLLRNNAGGILWLSLGTVAAPALYPPLRIQNNMDANWQEFELPRVEFFADMIAWTDVMVAGGSLDIQVEVEERG